MKTEKSVTSRLLRTAPGLLISSAVIIWLVLTCDMEELGNAFRAFDPGWIVPLVGIYAASFLVRGWRWRIMLHPHVPITWLSSTGIVLLGYLFNNLLPARLGEVVRAFALHRKTGSGKSMALMSVFVERVFDGLTIVCIFAFTAVLGPVHSEHRDLVLRIGWLALAIFALALAGVILCRVKPDWVLRIMGILTARMPERWGERIGLAIRDSLKALEFIQWNSRFCLFLVLSAAVWLLEGAMFWLGLGAMNLEADAIVAYFTLAVVNLGILVPSAPAYVGVFQGCAVIAMAVFGIGKTQALGYSMVIHALQFLTVSILGVITLYVMGFSFSALSSAGEDSNAVQQTGTPR